MVRPWPYLPYRLLWACTILQLIGEVVSLQRYKQVVSIERWSLIPSGFIVESKAASEIFLLFMVPGSAMLIYDMCIGLSQNLCMLVSESM